MTTSQGPCLARTVASAVASAEDRKRFVMVHSGRRVGGVKQSVCVSDDQALCRKPGDDRVDGALVKRWVAAFGQGAQQRSPVARALATELYDVRAHRLD